MIGNDRCGQARIEALKEVEAFCYHIAFFLLEREEDAIYAVREALLELCEEGRFFHECREVKISRAKHMTMIKSLERKQILWLEALLSKKNA